MKLFEKLHEQNFINDTFYAESYLNQAKFVTFKGPKSVVFDLQRKVLAIRSFKQCSKAIR